MSILARMIRIVAIAVLAAILLLVLISVVIPACDSPPREVVVRAGRLIDGTGAPAREGMRIRIQDGNIVAVEPDIDPFEASEDTVIIDARDATVMPGLVNSHAHLFSSGSCTPGVGAGPAQAIRNLHALLAGGVTTVADLGAPTSLALALRDHVGTARQRGPRVLVAGPMLTAKGGYPIDLFGVPAVEAGMVVEIATLKEARAAVRTAAAAGVDVVKVALQEQSYNGGPIPILSEELLCEIVKEAWEQELRVVAHTTSRLAYRTSLACGVAAMMHGSLELLDQEIVDLLRASATPVVPTHFVFEAPLWGPKHLDLLERPEVQELLSPEVIEDLRAYAAADQTSGDMLPGFIMEGISRRASEEAVEAILVNTRQLREAGVPIGLGTDGGICFNLHGSPIEELKRFEKAGYTPLEVLRLATHGGARVLDLHDAIGQLVPGYRADLIVVEGRPDQDLEDIVNIRAVMIDGVQQSLDGPSWGQYIAGFVTMTWAYLTD